MYDYMKALQKRFDRQVHSETDTEVEYAQEGTAAGHGCREARKAAAAVGRTKHIAG